MPSLAPRLDTLESTPSFSGAASFAAGSAAAPSLRFTVDPTTGLYRIGAGNIGFACAGVAAGGINASAWTLGSASTVGVGGYTHSIQAAPTSSTVIFLRNMMASSTITQIQVFYNSTTSAGYWRADNVNSFFVTNAAGTLQNFAVADTGACTLGNTSATGPSGGHHVFRTGYSGVSTSMYSNGEIHFGNSDSGGTIPTIAGTTTTANNVGLYLSAAANNSNTASDMNFDVRESDVANGSDFATLTNKAFIWTRYGNELASMTRAGACTLGPAASTAKNLIVNGHSQTYSSFSMSGVSIASGTTAATTFVTKGDTDHTTFTAQMIVTTGSNSTPTRGAVGIFALAVHAGGSIVVTLISSTTTNSGHSFVAGAPGANQIGIVGTQSGANWLIQWQGNTLGESYRLGMQLTCSD